MKKQKSKNLGTDYMWLALSAFGGLGLDVLLAFGLEPILYGVPMDEWNSVQCILHWILICLIWGIVAWRLVRSAQKKCHFSLHLPSQPMKLWQWGVALTGLVLVTVMNWMDWGGFKVLLEFQKKGLLLFTFQYIYYAFETALFLLIIVFGQKAFEEWFHNSKIPYGGILCGLTWGLAHLFTKGSLLIGLEGIVIGFLFGTVYLLVNRNIKKAYLLLFLMFVL